MKKIYLILLAAVSFAFTSCLMEEKDLFDMSASERLDAYISEYQDLLASSKDGWVLNYFPEEEQSYGGYAFVLLFSKNDVTAWFQLDDDVTTPVTSLYKVTTDDGPTITFDTYNENIHFFATPDIQNYQAMHGDYEFRIVGKSEDGNVIDLRGKRTNNVYKLVKFSGDPVDYINKCNAVDEAMTAPAYKLTIDGVECNMSRSDNHLDITYSVGEGEEAVEETVAVPFCYTPEGASFYLPVEIAGQTYSGMVYNAENSTLSTEDGKVVMSLVFPPINKVLVANPWFVASSQMTGAIKSAFTSAEAYIKSGYGMDIQYVILGSYLYPTFGLQHIIGGYGGSCGLTYELIGEDKIKFAYDAATNQVNGKTFYNAGLVLVVNQLSKTYTVTTDNVRKPSYLILTDDADANSTMKLLPPEVPYK